jgi:ElaB/YqjD/DUF883 family membrane-anchored ribosome-binding protein
MRNSISNDFGAHLANQAAFKAEQALASTRLLANEAIDGLACLVDDLRGATGPALDRVTGQAAVLAQGGIDAVRDGSHRLADKVRQAGDGTVRYIQHEPVKAVLMAAATGATLIALVSLVAGRRSRD